MDRLQPGSAGYTVPAGLRLRRRGRAARWSAPWRRSCAATRCCGPPSARWTASPVQVVHPAAAVRSPRGGPVRAADGAAREAEVAPPLRPAEARRLRPDGRAAVPRHAAAAGGPRARAAAAPCTTSSPTGGAWACCCVSCGASYDAFAAGRPSPLPELALQYADFAAWQREQAAGARRLERELAYWTERLAGAPGLLELPADRPRPAVLSTAAPPSPCTLSAGTAERLRALGRARGRHAVHGAAGRLPAPAGALVRHGRRGGGHARGRADARGGGGAHRPVRQHAGAADGPVRRPLLPRAAAPRARDGAGRVRRTRTSPSSGWWMRCAPSAPWATRPSSRSSSSWTTTPAPPRAAAAPRPCARGGGGGAHARST